MSDSAAAIKRRCRLSESRARAAARGERRIVGSCATCGGDVVRHNERGELASCPKGCVSIPEAFVENILAGGAVYAA
jgi:hypothetical protein